MGPQCPSCHCAKTNDTEQNLSADLDSMLTQPIMTLSSDQDIRSEYDEDNNKLEKVVIRNDDGSVYSGQVKTKVKDSEKLRVKKHGFGTMIYADKSQYEGMWKNGRYHGKGSYVTSRGDKYKGDFDRGVFHGYGVLSYKNGTKYEGEFISGKKNGQGKEMSHEGYVYTGNWVNGYKEGKGVACWTDGQKYDGEWKQDKFQGHGTLIQFCKTGKVQYKGNFLDNEKYGPGTIEWEDKHKFVGDWASDMPQGEGEFTDGNRKTVGGTQASSKCKEIIVRSEFVPFKPHSQASTQYLVQDYHQGYVSC